MMKPSLKPEEIIHIGEYQRHYHYYKPKHTHTPPNQHLVLFWMYQSKQDPAVSAAWMTQAPCQAHQPPPTFYSGGSQLTLFWPWGGGAVGSAGLADKSFRPSALCLSPSSSFLPETGCDAWSHWGHLVTWRQIHVAGRRNRSQESGLPCSLWAHCNGHKLLPCKVPVLEKNKSSPDCFHFY